MAATERTKILRWLVVSVVTIPLLGVVALWLALPQVDSRPAPPRTICRGNLSFIGLAMRQYHEAYGCFPPAYIADEDGHPKHSWRVLLLPFLSEEALYKAYSFDEPWNGPQNAELSDHLAKTWGKEGQVALPCVFACPSSPQSDKTTTDYVAIVGKRFAFGDAEPRKLGDTIRDGPATTILIVEVLNSGIHWMEPRDLTLDQIVVGSAGNQRLISMSRHEGGFNALFCNGEVRFIPSDIRPTSFEAMLTTDGGEVVDSSEF